MKVLTRFFVLFVFNSWLLVGCDATLRKELVIRDVTESNGLLELRVGEAFEEFATSHGFTCEVSVNATIIKSCRARGPLFLDFHREDSSFVVSLNQPYPGGLHAQPPAAYTSLANELEIYFKRKFGNAVAIIK